MNNNSDYSDMLNWKIVIGLSGPIGTLKLQEVLLLVLLIASCFKACYSGVLGLCYLGSGQNDLGYCTLFILSVLGLRL